MGEEPQDDRALPPAIDLAGQIPPNRPIHRPIDIRLQPPLVDSEALFQFPAPVRLFEILRNLDLSVQGNYEDDQQQLWKPDTLVAQSLNLIAHHPAVLLR